MLEFRRAVEPLIEPLGALAGRRPMPCSTASADSTSATCTTTSSGSPSSWRRSTHLLDSALNANVAQVGMRQNEDMRKISAWVAIIAVPTMIAGIYGMNFEHMPELDWRVGYPLVLGAHGGGVLAAVPQLQAPRLALSGAAPVQWRGTSAE